MPEAPPAPTPAPPPPPPARTPERREDVDPASLTTEMEAIGDDVKKRREVDRTLARFSAVHDELAVQERQRKERRQKLMPWKSDDAAEPEATQFAVPLGEADLDVEDEEADRPRVRTPRQRKVIKLVKIIALTAAVIVFLATGFAWGAKVWVDSKITQVQALNENSAAVHQADKQLGDENFLIVGSDTRAGAKPQDGVGDASKEQGARSDVLMLAHVPADRKRVVVVSIPRDIRVDRPACEQWNSDSGQYTGEQIPAAKEVMANEAYAVGGPKCVTEMVAEITHLRINHFVSVDFNGFKEMVDAVGSVEVCVSRPMEDEELGTVLDKAGKQRISGDTALKFVRARKVQGDLFSDYDRIQRQQKFLSSLLRQALSNETLLNPSKLNSFINAFAKATVGQNIGVDDMLTLGQSLQGLDAGRVSFVTIPHWTDDGATPSPDDNIERVKQDEANTLFQSIIDGTPLPGEAPDANTKAAAPAPASSATPATPKQGNVIDPKNVRIQVLNADQAAGGIGKRTAEALGEKGFSVVQLGNHPVVKQTVIKYGAGGEDAAATLKAAVPSAVLEVDPSMGGAVALVIGPDFDENVVTPQPGAGAVQPGAGDQGKSAPATDLSIVNGGADPCA